MIKTIIGSAFNPNGLSELKINNHILKYGFLFIFIRWGFYSLAFIFFRDYKQGWKPFYPPPFGLSNEIYGFFQSKLSILFGFFLMSMIAGGLLLLLKINRHRAISFMNILNILGFTYFIPFVILQPLDYLTIKFIGWTPFIIIPLHTSMLLWEAITTITIIDKIDEITSQEKVIGVIIQMMIWIIICMLLWR